MAKIFDSNGSVYDPTFIAVCNMNEPQVDEVTVYRLRYKEVKRTYNRPTRTETRIIETYDDDGNRIIKKITIKSYKY